MSFATINCPQCMGPLQLPAEMAGKLVRCPACKATFTANLSGTSGASSVGDREGIVRPANLSEPIPVRPPLAPTKRNDDRDARPWCRDNRYDDDYDDRRGYRRSYRGYDDFDDSREGVFRRQEREVEDARSSVAAPAISLMILGIGHLLIGLTVIAFLASRSGHSPERPFWLIVAMGLIFWGAIIFFGGFMMKSLRSYGFAIAGSVMALITIPYNVFGIAFGIWSLVVLSKSQTVRAFRWKAGKD